MRQVHLQFKLNGISLGQDALSEVAYSWVKEGEDFESFAGEFLLDWLSPSETHRVQTSGSTGKPKTLLLKKEAMVNSALATGQYFGLKPGDRALLCLPIEFIAGKMMLVRAMVIGLHLDIIAPSSRPMRGIKSEYDFAAMVPLQVQNSLDVIHGIKKLIVGGAPISKSLRKRLVMQSSGIFETYGMTETITHIAVKRVSRLKGKKGESSFKTLPGVNISKDKRGCLVIHAPKIANNLVVTNDLVDILDENYFKWLGRYDNVVNSGGVKLIPEQIEEKLSPFLDNRFFVTGIPDEKLGEQLVLFIEGTKQQKEVVSRKIREVKALEKFEVPKQVIYVKNFLETVTGKVQRQKIKSQFLNN
ncbi:MAG: AMP-binding protein [Bacteroidota bacterium]